MLTNYFTLLDKKAQEDGSVIFTLRLNPDCEVYKGHFPGNPVSPGVCNLQMIKECVENHTGKELTISDIKQCRYTAVITPLKHSILYLKANIVENEGTYTVSGSVYNDTEVFIDIKETLV